MLSFGAQPLKPPPENPTLARKCLAQKANTSGLYRLELALPERHKQHDNGKENADDAVEAWGGLLRLREPE